MPSLVLGAKCLPGRLNQVSVLINREGVFYGQCSEKVCLSTKALSTEQSNLVLWAPPRKLRGGSGSECTIF